MTQLQELQDTLELHYAENGRVLPWRNPDEDGTYNPYKILVSEMMLQQTQVPRVIPKYLEFLEAFPSVETLAEAPLADVLTAWQGLGYNRRAKYLHEAAKTIVTEYGGVFPRTKAELIKLPGIGPNTAGAILAYAYNLPEVFIETNVRTVFLHHFFHNQESVPDAAIIELVKQSISTKDPRSWYWSLMDYGAHIKKTIGNPNVRSKHYIKQSQFEGSKRQLRGSVLKQLRVGPTTYEQLQSVKNDRLDEVLQALQAEGLIFYENEMFYLGQRT